jgi:hypothetical protein
MNIGPRLKGFRRILYLAFVLPLSIVVFSLVLVVVLQSNEQVTFASFVIDSVSCGKSHITSFDLSHLVEDLNIAGTITPRAGENIMAG